jgi:hypothetical protein
MLPPSWLLHTRADVLLTTGFRGGLNGRGHIGQDLLGPRPWTNIDLGLLPKAKRQRRDAALAVQVASAEVGFTSSTNEVIKGDSQKAYNASVPDHLWLQAFALSYGDATCLARHLDALDFMVGGCTLHKDPPADKDPHAGWLLHKEPPAGWRGALLGFRFFFLMHWRHQVMRGYLKWQIANVPLPPRNGVRLVEYHMEWQQGVEQPIYGWTKAERRAHQAEWRAMRALAG